MNKELMDTIEYLEREKNIQKEGLFDAIRHALISACRRTFVKAREVDVQINPMTAEIELFENGEKVFNADFGRIAAQTAKQVIIQKIREAERDSIFNEFHKKIGTITSGAVHRVDRKMIIIDFGKVEAILPVREQSPNDNYRQGEVIRVFILDVKKSERGPEVIVSRGHEQFVSQLFQLEVPEIREGIVEIRAVAREAGARTKIAVHSKDSKIDCVGSCVGMRGQRVKNIVRELGGEKIDIVRWSEDSREYIQNALNLTEQTQVDIKIHREEKSAEIFVDEQQLSLVIGKRGQNVRLASKLTGWKLDIHSKSQRIPLSALSGMTAEIEKILNQAGIIAIKDLLKSTPEDLEKIEGIDAERAGQLIHAAQQAVVGDTSKHESP